MILIIIINALERTNSTLLHLKHFSSLSFYFSKVISSEI